MTDDATAASGTYTAEVDREDGWWTIHVLELDVVTQAARWSEVEGMARGVVIAMLDLDEDADVALEVVPVFDDEAGQLLQDAEESEARARELAAFASDAKRTAVQVLKSAGWTLQGIAAGIGLSYQRVEQLLKDNGGSSPSTENPPDRGQARGSRISTTHPKEVAVPVRSAKSSRYGSAGARSPRTTVREAAGPNKSSATAHRSATTGRYVTKSTAQRNPNGTVTGNR